MQPQGCMFKIVGGTETGEAITISWSYKIHPLRARSRPDCLFQPVTLRVAGTSIRFCLALLESFMTQETQPIHPHYGKNFRCIGSACEDTCCHGFTIPMDKATYEKYQAFPEGEIRSLATKYISLTTTHTTDSLYAQIDLTAAKDCPFLTTERLCGVQKEHGPKSLSATCSIYPRVLNRVGEVLEISLYLSC